MAHPSKMARRPNSDKKVVSLCQHSSRAFLALTKNTPDLHLVLCARQDSNLRPADQKSAALSRDLLTENRPLLVSLTLLGPALQIAASRRC
jgi:hypothetical protein